MGARIPADPRHTSPDMPRPPASTACPSPGFLILAGLVALFLTGGGCTRKGDVETGALAGVLLYANGSEPSDLDPAINGSTQTAVILNALFEGLVVLGNDGRTILPGVADRWEISPDGLAYTFHIRDGARWSNGAPLTSQDFLRSFRRVFDPALGCPEASFGFAIAGAEARARGLVRDDRSLGLRAPDPHTFIITLIHPSPYFLSILGLGAPFTPVYWPALEQCGGVHERGKGWTREGRLVSNGPFVLASWKEDTVIAVAASPTYWDRAHVALSGIRFTPVDDRAVQERAFRAGQYAVTTGFPGYTEGVYRRENPGALRTTAALKTYFLTFNEAQRPFADPRIRRALSLAIDRERLVSAVHGTLAVPAHSFVRPGTGGYRPPDSDACLTDVGGARRLLAEAGAPAGRGLPPIELMLVGTDQEAIKAGEVVQTFWRTRLGIRTVLVPTEIKVYLDARQSRRFQVVLESWSCKYDDPTAALQIARTGNPNNDSGWSDTAFDALYDQIDRAPPGPARVSALDRAERRLAEAVPYAPLYFWNRPHLVHPSVHGWPENPVGQVDWRGISVGP